MKMNDTFFSKDYNTFDLPEDLVPTGNFDLLPLWMSSFSSVPLQPRPVKSLPRKNIILACALPVMSHKSKNHEFVYQVVPKNTTPQLKTAGVKLGPFCKAHSCIELD